MRNYKNPTILKVFTPKSLTAGSDTFHTNRKHLIIIDIPYEIIYGKF